MQNKLFELMVQKRMNQKTLSEKSGVGIKTISLLQHQRTKGIDFATLFNLCVALDCTPNDFFEFEKKTSLKAG